MKKNDIKESVIKGIISAVPYLGGTVTSIWSDIQAERKHERLLEFYTALDDEIKIIKEKLNVGYISKPDFLDVFEATVKFVINERSNEKRRFFKNILLNGMMDKIADYDKTEKFLRIVDDMSNPEIIILKIFFNPVIYNKNNGELVRDPNWTSSGVRNSIIYTKTYSIIEILKSLLPDYSKDEIIEALYFTERNRLVIENIAKISTQSNGHPIDLLKDRLTRKGNDFILYIEKSENITH